MAKEALLERIRRLEENIKELSLFREKVKLEEVRADKIREWALRYGLFKTIQAVIDIACHLVSLNNLGSPATYSECITLLEKNGYIDSNLAQRLVSMVGLRNLLIHEYATINVEALYRCLSEIEDFVDFVHAIQPYIG